MNARGNTVAGRTLFVMLIAVGMLTHLGCDVLPPTNGGGDGGEMSAMIVGTVTNEATGEGLAEAIVLIGDVEATTDETGAYAQEVDAGVYAVTFESGSFNSLERSIAVASGETATVDAALTPSQAIAISTTMEGDASPGSDVTVMATVEVLDGETAVSGFAWNQSNSVEVTLSGENTDSVSVSLPDAASYKAELMAHLREPPVTADQLPSNVPAPDVEDFPAGLPDRFQVVGINPFALEEAALVTLTVTVETSAGEFTEDVEIHAELPWRVATSLRNVPIDVPVLLSGKIQDTYDWALSTPSGSSAALTDATTQEPYFTPDATGMYSVTVTDTTGEADEVITLEIFAGTWVGVITGLDADGFPLAADCTSCHNGGIADDQFTPWSQTGHAEIFTNNLNTSTHYGENCFACHTIGFDTRSSNGGIDDASDYQAFLDAGLINNPGDNWHTVVNDFPETARLANIQCESCHGPQGEAGSHTMGEPRISLAADVCATCHGEPLRHARFQQWQLSGHANFDLAIDEGESGNCSRCHTANGFLAWLPILLDDDPETDPLESIEVTWDLNDTQPQTCAVCHDPHDIGTTSGSETNATVRISGDTPPLIAGFQVFGAGRGAICMTCHNSRRGLRNDSNFDQVVMTSEAARAPHGSSQADVLMGENAYLVEVGIRGSHSLVTDTCVVCHMVETPPPDVLSYNQGGTNHTFLAADDVCAACHTEIDNTETVETAFEATSGQLQLLVEAALLELIEELTVAGNSLDLNGEAVITNVSQISAIEFGEARGRQAMTVTLAGPQTFGPYRMNDVTVLDADDMEIGAFYDFADERLIKAGWNWNLANNDGSHGAHNPTFVFAFMDAAIDALNEMAAE